VNVARGVFRWANGGSFTAANLGDLAFVSDDQTVTTAASATYDVIAGVIVDVDSDGVWVDTFDIGAQGAATPSSLAVSGNATVGGTLGVTGAATLSSTLGVSGNLTVGSSKLTVAASSGNTAVGGTLGVTGTATFSTNVTISGTAILIANLPTATNGLAVGTLWSDSGDVKVMQ
jgi:hypothetical protein